MSSSKRIIVGDYPPGLFPLTIEIVHLDRKVTVWSTRVEHSGPVEIPHWPGRRWPNQLGTRITFADGTQETAP